MNNNEQNKKKTTGILLSVLSIISLVLITAGVTYAFFSYAKEGLTENVLTTGTITFYYDEQRKEGNGIKIENAVPISDAAGKVLANMDGTTGNIFTFKVTSTNTGTIPIKYKITARRKDTSAINNNAVKLYLEASGSASNAEGTNNKTVVGGKVQTFGSLTQYDKVEEPTIEKVIYEEQISDDSKADYNATFTLRMWLAQNNEEEGTNTEANYSAYEFVKKELTAEVEEDTDGAYDADALIEAEDFITSTEYYALPLTSEDGQDSRANYERVAYVDQEARKIIPATKASEKKYITIDENGFITENEETKLSKENYKFGEQFYQLNNQEFKVLINVYANAEVVQTP